MVGYSCLRGVLEVRGLGDREQHRDGDVQRRVIGEEQTRVLTGSS